jgi:hypothetical protein
VVGTFVATRPGLSITVLVVLVGGGFALLLSGVVQLVAAIRGRTEERLTSAMGGLAGVGFGLVVLGWPRLTLFIIGVVFGAWLVFFGLSQAITAALGWRRPHPTSADQPPPRSRRHRRLRAVGAGAALLAAVGLLAASIWVRAGSPAIVPDAFYTPPTDLPAAPGRLPVLSVVHATTGIVPGCAPSLSPTPFADGAGTALARLVVDHGWVGVISDYVGLGTAGPHAYLVGEAAARNVLDATRAARRLSQLRLDRRTVVWGHSQGGHGAIWAGSIGPRYAPELNIVGMAALAPATDLHQLATGVKNTTFGRVVSAYLADSWAAYYPQLDMSRLVDRRYRRTVSRIGQRCFSGRDALAAAITSQLFGPVFTPSALSGTFARPAARQQPSRAGVSAAAGRPGRRRPTRAPGHAARVGGRPLRRRPAARLPQLSRAGPPLQKNVRSQMRPVPLNAAKASAIRARCSAATRPISRLSHSQT